MRRFVREDKVIYILVCPLSLKVRVFTDTTLERVTRIAIGLNKRDRLHPLFRLYTQKEELNKHAKYAKHARIAKLVGVLTRNTLMKFDPDNCWGKEYHGL